MDGPTSTRWGRMLYHMVTGQPPFEGGDALAVAVKHLQEEPVRAQQLNPAVPADWDALILKAMAKDPAKRFQSAREMVKAIEMLLEEPGPLARTKLKPQSGDGFFRATTSALVVVALAACALLIGRHFATAGGGAPIQVNSSKAVVATLRSRDLYGSFTHLALTRGALWDTNTTSGKLIRFDTKTNREAAVVRVGNPAEDPGQNDPFDVVFGAGQLWTTDRADRALVRVDPGTKQDHRHRPHRHPCHEPRDRREHALGSCRPNELCRTSRRHHGSRSTHEEGGTRAARRARPHGATGGCHPDRHMAH